MANLLSLLKWAPLPVVPVAAGAIALWPARVEGERASPGPVVVEVLGVGTLESPRVTPVAFEVSGRVTAVDIDAGDVVAAGSRLGLLERDVAVHERDRARSEAAAAARDVERARAELARARATFELAAVERDRTFALFEGGNVPAATRDAAIEHAQTSGAAVASAEAIVRRAEATVAAAESGQRARETQVADALLESPLDGLVLTRHVELGAYAQAGAPAFTIADTSALEVHAWVDESALARLAPGQEARLVFRSEPDRSYPGRVARVGRQVDRATHELVVEIAVLEPPRNFAIGQRADAWITLDRRDAAVSVPRGWCASTCRVAEGGFVVEKPVSLGLVGRDRVEVLGGLRAGEIVLAPEAPSRGLVRAVVP